MEPDFCNLKILSEVACELLEREREEKIQQLETRRQQEDHPQVSTQKQQVHSSPEQLRAPPEWLLHFIQSNGGSQPVFIFSKRLTRSDVDKEQSRLLLNHQAVNNMAAQLDENEMNLVNQNKLEVMVVDSQGRVHSMAYKKYASGAHRFISGWVGLCESLGLKSCQHCVQIWSFRVDQVDAYQDGVEDGEVRRRRRSQFWLAIESTRT
ncbi:DNA-binding pseudobarrel domain-containing protein [Dioscorea alata]|uniref:DNA-binding pseudobarrel domain-containing protein n=1 Tax=Dioscorea alata TaxID=55571 RepID=A0ACB7VKQ1_DIOAL|nr:DNA-binding pseudobarrel domain-containing protein [Dioscorea alata]